MKTVAPLSLLLLLFFFFFFFLVAATAAPTVAPRDYPPTQGAGACNAIRTNSTAQLEEAVSSLLAHTTATGDFPKALAALLANATSNSGSTSSSIGVSYDRSTSPQVAGSDPGASVIAPEVSVSDNSGLTPLNRGLAWLKGLRGDSDDASDDTPDDIDASDDDLDDPIYAPSQRPAPQDRTAQLPATAGASTESSPESGTDNTATAPSPSQVAAGSRAGLQSASNGVNVANDILRGNGVSSAIRDGARATAQGANAAAIAGPPPSTSRSGSSGGGAAPRPPRLSLADAAAGANAVADGAGLASAIGNIAGSVPAPPRPGRLSGGLPGRLPGRPPGRLRRPGGILRKRRLAWA